MKERRELNGTPSRSGDITGKSVGAAATASTNTFRKGTPGTGGGGNNSSGSPRGQLLLTILGGIYFGITVPVWWYGFQDAELQMIRMSPLIPPVHHRVDRPAADQESPLLGIQSQSQQQSEPQPVTTKKKKQQQQQQQKKNPKKQQPQSPPLLDPRAMSNSSSSAPSIPFQQQAQVRKILQRTHQRSFLPLQAITEQSNHHHHLGNNRSNYFQYTKPIPIRTHPQLQTFTYFQTVHSCHDLPSGWPVDHPPSMDTVFGPNFDILGSLYEKRQDYAEYCPVDLDPFLPWIHDVLPSWDGRYIDIIAHNKRRCRQDPALFQADQDNLEPQVALLQSVSIQRLSPETLANLHDIPDDWKTPTEPRYRLAPIEEADEDAKETRFICQFHMLQPTKEKEHDTVERVVVGETLSVYLYNYEHANLMHRKGQKPHPMLTRARDSNDHVGFHNEQVWNAILHVQCPVPVQLQELVASGALVENDIPSLYMDLVPIRTPPRDDRDGYNPWHLSTSSFDPLQEWGPHHVLPPVSKSGRWQNVPICKPAIKAPPTSSSSRSSRAQATVAVEPTKENYLLGCLWASASFSTRGEDRLDTSTQDRLLEWLTYHLEVAGFDKMIIYDNTEAFTNMTSLKPITDLFGEDRIIRIPWKHRVCNNNRPTHPNAGERSSQYAAEASCRIRYGPTTEWLIAFDTDEYLIPQGDYTSMKEWLKDSVANGNIGTDTHILNFYQIRAMLNSRFTEPFQDDDWCSPTKNKQNHCLTKQSNATFMESFCEAVQFPKPDFTGRAKKQLYRPSFVLNHFVHYAAVTRLINEKPTMHRVVGYPYERRVVELTEAFMLHTKTTPQKSTREYKTRCTVPDNGCRVGFPWPFWQEDNKTISETNNTDGYAYNCFENRKVHTVMVGKLRAAMQPYLERWKSHHVGTASMGKIEVSHEVPTDPNATEGRISRKV